MPNDAYTLDRAKPEDLDGIVALENACFHPSIAFSRRQWRCFLANPLVTIPVVRYRGRVIADALVLRRRTISGVTGRIYTMAVTREHRGTGLGRMLLDDCLAALRAEGVTRVFLEVGVSNQAAISLYESAGFVKTHRLRDYYAPGQDAWKMRLRA